MPEPTPLPRVFIACAPQDQKYSDLIATKAQQDRLPLVFDTFGEGRIDDPNWQRECRRRIAGARLAVVVMSTHTRESARVVWQVGCARQEGLSIMGVTVTLEGVEDHTNGEVIDPISVIGWKWKGIASMIMRLATAPGPKVVTPDRMGELVPPAAPSCGVRPDDSTPHNSAA